MRPARAVPFCFAVCGLLAGCATVPREHVATGQHPQSFAREVDGRTVGANFLLYIPEGYPRSRGEWPLVLFLHGKGERGDDLSLVTRHGLAKEIARGEAEFPFIAVSPQCPDTAMWADPSQIEVLDALIDDLVARHRIDEDRIYVTGMSMGGAGTWTLAAAYPDRFAAIAPVCGRNDPAIAPTIAHLPIWIFHGEKDAVVPVWHSRNIAAALEAEGADFRLTIYPDATHDSWSRTYANPELYAWMLGHRRGSR